MLNWIVNLLRSFVSFFSTKRNVPQATRSNTVNTANLHTKPTKKAGKTPRFMLLLDWLTHNMQPIAAQMVGAPGTGKHYEARMKARIRRVYDMRAKRILTLRRKAYRNHENAYFKAMMKLHAIGSTVNV